MDCHFNAQQVDYLPLSHSNLQLSLSVHNATNALRVEPIVRVQEIMQSLHIHKIRLKQVEAEITRYEDISKSEMVLP